MPAGIEDSSRFEVRGVLGRGGMGEGVLALDRQLGRDIDGL